MSSGAVEKLPKYKLFMICYGTRVLQDIKIKVFDFSLNSL